MAESEEEPGSDFSNPVNDGGKANTPKRSSHNTGHVAGGSGYTDAEWAHAEDTLYSWTVRARANEFGHHAAAAMHGWIGRGLGVIAIGLTVGSQISKGTSATLGPVLAALGSAFVAIQTFFKEGETASRHLIAANRYSAIRKRLEAIDGTPRRARADIASLMGEMSDEINDAAKNSPPLPNFIWEKAQDEADKQVMKDTFVNRLSSKISTPKA